MIKLERVEGRYLANTSLTGVPGSNRPVAAKTHYTVRATTDGLDAVCAPAPHCTVCLHLPPCLQVLQSASERVFVPLTVGGGIRGFTAGGQTYPALQVASEYFRCVDGECAQLLGPASVDLQHCSKKVASLKMHTCPLYRCRGSQDRVAA